MGTRAQLILVAVAIVALLLACGLAAIGLSTLIGGDDPGNNTRISTRCIGLLNIGSCNVRSEQRTAPESNNDILIIGLLLAAGVLVVFLLRPSVEVG